MRSLRKLAPFFVVTAIAAGSLLVAACSDDDGDEGNGAPNDHGDRPEECQALIDACHTKDPGTPGKINDCHAPGHEGTAEECQAKIDEGCIDTCDEAPVVNPSGDGGGHANHGGGDDGGSSADHAMD